MASDSRLSDETGVLLDEGVKLFEVPVRMFVQTTERATLEPIPFPRPDVEVTFGIVCAGSTLLFQQVYATLVPLLGNVQCLHSLSIPTVEQRADFVARLLTIYTRSLGANRPGLRPVSIVVGGVDPQTGEPQMYDLTQDSDREGRIEFRAEAVQTTAGDVQFRGEPSACLRAAELLQERRAAPTEAHRQGHNRVLDVISHLAADTSTPTVGGAVQVGYTSGLDFHRVTRASPGDGEHAGMARFLLNGIDVMDVGGIGLGHPFLTGIA